MNKQLAPKISALIFKLEGIRSNLYPKDWDADPLYQVVRELRQLEEEAGEGR
jgi:hypothetical protein